MEATPDIEVRLTRLEATRLYVAARSRVEELFGDPDRVHPDELEAFGNAVMAIELACAHPSRSGHVLVHLTAPEARELWIAANRHAEALRTRFPGSLWHETRWQVAAFWRALARLESAQAASS